MYVLIWELIIFTSQLLPLWTSSALSTQNWVFKGENMNSRWDMFLTILKGWFILSQTLLDRVALSLYILSKQHVWLALPRAA